MAVVNGEQVLHKLKQTFNEVLFYTGMIFKNLTGFIP